jgi:hypothetical protein
MCLYYFNDLCRSVILISVPIVYTKLAKMHISHDDVLLGARKRITETPNTKYGEMDVVCGNCIEYWALALADY